MTTKAELIAWLKSADPIKTIIVEITGVGSAPNSGNFYLASRPYVTSPTDSPANQVYEAAILGGVSFSESLSLDGSISINYGDIEIVNTNGIRDAWLGYVWDNRPINVYIGDPRWPRADFYQIFSGVIQDIAMRSQDVINIIVLDKLQKLNKFLTETTYVTGLSGAAIAAEAAINPSYDKIKPRVYGECFNITPYLINKNTLTYQVHDGPIEGIIEIRDGGAPLTVTTQYTVNAAAGTFTLLQKPFSTITCSVQGKKTGTYTDKPGEIILDILTEALGGTSEINTSAFTTFNAANTQAVGIYLTDKSNVLEVCNELASSIGAQLTTSDGLYKLVKLDLSSLTSPTAVTWDDMTLNSLYPSEKAKTLAQVTLAYCKNWTVQSDGLANGLSATSKTVFDDEYFDTDYKEASQAGYTIFDSTKATELLANASIGKIKGTEDDPIGEPSLLISKTDAFVEAQRRLNLWKVPRYIYTAEYLGHMLLTQLGDPITITHERYGLAAGKTGMVVNVERNWTDSRVTIGVLI